MRSFRDYLISASYELEWLERPEGHSWGLWRATIDRMLIYFFPGSSSDVITEDFISKDFVLYQIIQILLIQVPESVGSLQ